MKRILLTGIGLLFALACFAQQRTEKDLVGKWQFKNNRTGFVFTKDHHVQPLGQSKDLQVEMTYSADFSKSPIPMRLTVSAGGQTYSIKCQIAFINDDTISWKVSPGGLPITDPGPLDKDGNATATLKRVKE